MVNVYLELGMVKVCCFSVLLDDIMRGLNIEVVFVEDEWLLVLVDI